MFCIVKYNVPSGYTCCRINLVDVMTSAAWYSLGVTSLVIDTSYPHVHHLVDAYETSSNFQL